MWLARICKKMSIFERTMAILTFAGVVIAIFTGLIFWKQLAEMRTDQRAWISFSAGVAQFPKDLSFVNMVPVTVPITINNIGKTPARIVHTEFVMDYEVNGGSPDFVYENRARTIDTAGMISPNSPQLINVMFSKAKLNKPNEPTEPRYLTGSEFNDMANGTGYMVIYAKAEFVDIFGTQHWLHYCTFFVAPNVNVTVTARQCTDYNDTDHD